MSVSVQLDARNLKRKTAAARKQFGDAALLRAIGGRHLAWIVENFDKDGALVGGWEALKPSTIANRRLGSSRPLQDTGKLKGSYTYRVLPGMVVVGTNVVYAPPHEFGYPPGGIPKRRMLPTEIEGETMAIKVIMAAVAKVNRSTPLG